jgi:glycosyltransferase involved in cell wall biosynthesis
MSGILLAGIARNVRGSLPEILGNLDHYGTLFDDYRIIIVEDNSTDGTKEFVHTWARQGSNRVYIEADGFPVGRNTQNPRGTNAPLLAGFRNIYMRHIEGESDARYAFVGIFDCDNVNVRPISYGSILAAARFLSEESSRAAVFANQRGFYYDIWALRHDAWCPGDCWQEYKTWCDNGLADKATWACLGSRQVHIPSDAPPIEVNSAFGGFAIYKTDFLKGQRYCDFGEDGVLACEHVSLHQEIRNRGGRLFIFPPLMNSTPYEHIKRPRDLYYWYIRLRETLR